MNESIEFESIPSEFERIALLSQSEAESMVMLFLQCQHFKQLEKVLPHSEVRRIVGEVARTLYEDGKFMGVCVPNGTPNWISDDLLKDSAFVLSPRYKRYLSTREIVAALENVGRLGEVLERTVP